MYSRNHALVSAVVGVPVAVGAPDPLDPVLLWTAVLLVGVGIDLDHFLIGRLNRGDWTNVRRCAANPALIVRDQGAIFDGEDVHRDQRLLSHLVIGGVLVGGLWPVGGYWAVAMAVAVYTHVVADLYADVRTRDQYYATLTRSD